MTYGVIPVRGRLFFTPACREVYTTRVFGVAHTVGAVVSSCNGAMSSTSPEPATTSMAAPAIRQVLNLLAPEYGPLIWKQRNDPVAQLVAAILSQHTSDVNTGRAFRRLLATFGSLEAVAQAEVGAIAGCIQSGGLAQIKAPRIKAVLNHILEHRGVLDLGFLQEFPLAEAKAWLTALPGVGPKTAAVVLCFSLGMPAMPVDTHVYRVAKRLGLIGDRVSADRAHGLLEAMVPPEDVYRFHMYLITHGRRVCKAQRPLCESCVLLDGCPTGRERLGLGAPSEG